MKNFRKTKSVILQVAILLQLFVISFQAKAQKDDGNMLDKSIGAVVTVGVFSSSGDKMILGFRDKKNNADKAYARILDMTGVQSSGSGFVVEKDGKKYIITNAHVVEDAKGDAGSIYVYSINQTKYPVKVVGGDSYYDFAVLEFLTPVGAEINAIKFAEKDPYLGEHVYAIGNPLGEYPYTVSDGIISAKNRVRGGITGKFGFLQHTATVIWGNSGGPLVNQKGEVVGINSQIAFAQKGEEQIWQPQINFALENEVCKRLFDDIITNNGLVKRAYIGVEVAKMYEYDELMALYGTPWQAKDTLPIIKNVIPGSPAAEVLKDKKGYVILEVNGVLTRNVNEVFGEFEKIKPGQILKLKIAKDAKIENVELKTTEISVQSLERLAMYVLESTGDFQLQKADNKVVMRSKNTNQNLASNKESAVKKDNLGMFTTATLPSGKTFQVVAAGLNYTNYVSKYRITKLSDIGAAMRLSGELGEIHLFVIEDGDVYSEPIQLNYRISGSQETYQHTLWY